MSIWNQLSNNLNYAKQFGKKNRIYLTVKIFKGGNIVMFIKDDSISNWKELQNLVGNLFTEMDYDVEIEKTIKLVRGKKEIDVYVKDTKSSSNLTFLIECKYWETKVSQETVHGFRTVVQDSGANAGYIVSLNGFQSGAYEAAALSNIFLVTFEELQHRFGNEWLYKMKQKLDEELDIVKENHRLYFAQDSMVRDLNAYIFFNDELIEKYIYYHKEHIKFLLHSDSIPTSYIGPEPVRCTYDPRIDETKQYEMKGFFYIPTVRDFFSMTIKCTKNLNTRFKDFIKFARNEFEKLSRNEQKEILDKNFERAKEELPIRVLKGILDKESYDGLIKKLR